MKLIAVDLDGTLLNKENLVSEKNLESIKYAQSKGIEVVVATGRAHFDVQTIFKDTGVKTWIIGANGATIHQPDGNLFHSVSINKQDTIDILSWLEQEDFYYEVFSNDAIFTPQNGRELLAIEMDRVLSANPDIDVQVLEDAAKKQFSQTGFSSITSYKDLVDSNVDIYNILAFSFDLAKLKRGRAKFESLKDLTLVSSADHNFELEHIDASKGIALKILANKLNIHLKDTAAVGDSFNDLSMFKIAGRSAAMGNAHQQIKDVCDEVTLSNAEDGVAHFIYSLIRNTESVS
ncbi:Cof-type HAD-IIB family hydrolase [Bacillus sp. V3-13]|uniref:Cof-type HAD-IIB family hydrolase n=1 Tax=Bacillus sp. V3-13 TaxID=2053728 RepID=UPI000C794D0A|nr:Cof-type HAD-IIB family hydrolase [Bacillus sp. V3-13]PLR77092.1 Cof-type HAD-IIB family hydrolase [Bacillus sp. V3-13]